MRIDILTVVPELLRSPLNESILKRAQEKGLVEIVVHNLHNYAHDKRKTTDDYPFGGEAGMVMQVEPVDRCIAALKAERDYDEVIFTSPDGDLLDQHMANSMSLLNNIIILCGHYKGVDYRIREHLITREISIGDYVLTGGELGSMVVTDCVCRMVPGVLSDTECYTGESHWAGRLEYPQYTRPETWEGRTVPEVLRGGNHAEIEAWRTRQSLERTLLKRPDLFQQTPPTPDEQRLLDKIRRDRSRPQLVEPPVCRIATEDDLPAILAIAQQARNYLRRHRVDQWQGVYPNEETFRADIAAGTCHVLTYQGTVAAMFTLTFAPEPAYDALTDGRWRSDRDHAAVLHRNAVSADFRGTGMADLLMQEVERLARAGYRFCGNILCDEPGHDPRRQAFEKLLK